jgi:hypothetical protein
MGRRERKRRKERGAGTQDSGRRRASEMEINTAGQGIGKLSDPKTTSKIRYRLPQHATCLLKPILISCSSGPEYRDVPPMPGRPWKLAHAHGVVIKDRIVPWEKSRVCRAKLSPLT